LLRYRILRFFLPLYTRIDEKKIEKGKMSRTAIREQLKVSKTTLRFNIKRLEETGRVVEEKSGRATTAR